MDRSATSDRIGRSVIAVLGACALLALGACSGSDLAFTAEMVGSSGDGGSTATGGSATGGSASGGSSGGAGQAGGAGTSTTGGGGTDGGGTSGGGNGGATAGSAGNSPGGSPGGGGSTAAGNGGTDTAGNGGTDTAGNGGTDTAGNGGTSAGDAGAAGSAGEGGACHELLDWFPDGDGDEVGRTSGKVTACLPPSEGYWVEEGGDCNDDNPSVTPYHDDYMEEPYMTAGGNDSFDYDCSDSEQSDPSQVGAAPVCPALAVNCAGWGYLGTGRGGAGVNGLCGSTLIRTCVKNGLNCNPVVSTISEPHRCR